MKNVFVVLMLISLSVKGQNWEEWTQQKKTQEKYLKQQIAALQVYIGYVKTGYKVVNNGINIVRNIKNGDFNLHRDFISRFSAVNPKVKGYAKVADIIAYQVRIIKEMKECLRGVRDAKQFTEAELEHCTMVINNLLASSLENMDELLSVITDGELQMKDDERIKRIDIIYSDMQDKYAFCSSYSEEMALLTVHRMREWHEIDLSKKLNGLQ